MPVEEGGAVAGMEPRLPTALPSFVRLGGPDGRKRGAVRKAKNRM